MNNLFIFVLLFLPITITAQKNNIEVYYSFKKAVSIYPVKDEKKRTVLRTMRPFLQENSIKFQTRDDNKKCIHCGRKINWTAFCNNYALIAYSHNGLGNHYHLIIYDTLNLEFVNLTSSYISEASSFWYFLSRLDNIENIYLARDF